MGYRIGSRRITLDVAALTETGPCREINEDTFLVTDLGRCASLGPEAVRARVESAGFVLGVYDGCGHGPGSLPGSLAAGAVHARMCDLPVAADADELGRHLREALAAANRAIFSAGVRTGMGATATVVGLVDHGLVLAQVGDTRAYRYRDGTLAQLTRDHTLIEEIRTIRALPPDEAARLPDAQRTCLQLSEEDLDQIPKNVVTRALGTQEQVSADLAYLELGRGDTLLLCTDGLTRLVDDAAIAAALRAHPLPGAACGALVDAAVAAGGHDNVTVVVAVFTGA